MEDYQEFRRQHFKPHRDKFDITNSYGVYDVYKKLRKQHWRDIGRPVKSGEFYRIIRGVNKKLANRIAAGDTVAFPYRMGKLELRKLHRGVSIVDGKLKITYPVNWKETWKLWAEDEEAFKNKTLIRLENNDVYCIRYNKFNVAFHNSMFYGFAVNNFIKDALKDNIRKGKIDALYGE